MTVKMMVILMIIQLTLLIFLFISSIFFLLASDVKLLSRPRPGLKIHIRKEGLEYQKRVIRTKYRVNSVYQI